MTDKDQVRSTEEALSLEQTLRLALEALESTGENNGYHGVTQYFDETMVDQAITAIKAALLSRSDGEAKDEPVGLIESLKDAQPCCGQYETCWRACTPRGKFIGHRDAQRKPLTDEEIGDEFVRFQVGGMFTPFLYAVRAIEAALLEKQK